MTTYITGTSSLETSQLEDRINLVLLLKVKSKNTNMVKLCVKDYVKDYHSR